MRSPFPLGFCVTILMAMAILPTRAQQNPGETESASSASAHKYFTDVPLITQEGNSVRLYSDLLKGKVVVITPFYGTCQSSCPVIAEKLSALQLRLGDRLGKQVLLLSFSVDPESDTPNKLKAFAERFHSRPGWLFLTGKKENLDTALLKLGLKIDRKEDHLNIFIIGSEKNGRWQKVNPLSKTPDEVLDSTNRVLEDRD